MSNNTLWGKQPEVIRALSWNQPYASLMLQGKIETRMYSTKVRGKVLICACKKFQDIELINEISGNRQYKRICETQIMDFVDENFLYGKAIAIGDLVDCRPMTYNDEDKCFVEFYSARWCWVFENIQAIEPFPHKGKQGWAILDQETIDKIKVLTP